MWLDGNIIVEDESDYLDNGHEAAPRGQIQASASRCSGRRRHALQHCRGGVQDERSFELVDAGSAQGVDDAASNSP